MASSPPSPHSSRRSPEPAAPQQSTHIMEHDAVVTSYKELIRDQVRRNSILLTCAQMLFSVQHETSLNPLSLRRVFALYTSIIWTIRDYADWIGSGHGEFCMCNRYLKPREKQSPWKRKSHCIYTISCSPHCFLVCPFVSPDLFGSNVTDLRESDGQRHVNRNEVILHCFIFSWSLSVANFTV